MTNSAFCGSISVFLLKREGCEIMIENDQIVIPEGWTYFAHRTNTERWKNNPFEEKVITVNKLMCVVTEADIYQTISHYGRNSTQAYTYGKGTPFEIRCLVCSLPYVREMPDDFDMKNIMLQQFYYDKNNFGGDYGHRHHSIPSKEELVVIALGEFDEAYLRDAKIIWTIPKRFLPFYQSEVQKGKNRTIDLKSPYAKKKIEIKPSKSK